MKLNKERLDIMCGMLRLAERALTEGKDAEQADRFVRIYLQLMHDSRMGDTLDSSVVELEHVMMERVCQVIGE